MVSLSKQILTKEEWNTKYTLNQLGSLVASIKNRNLSTWAKEMLKITSESDSTLEIGSGTGSTSLLLALNGRKATALDFSESALELTGAAAKTLGCEVDLVLADACKELPFQDDEFAVVFHAGLLEHFETAEERANLLRHWGRVGKKMISMVPNGASVPYRLGKARQEKLGTWRWGETFLQHTQCLEFAKAGFTVEAEYSVGIDNALRYLPKWHPYRMIFSFWDKHNSCGDNCHQGYLLVTIGTKI